jgi:hypothetical protein
MKMFLKKEKQGRKLKKKKTQIVVGFETKRILQSPLKKGGR